MTNETFSILTDEDKNTKLRTVLKSRTENSLTDEELSAILCGISLNRQYSVHIFDNPSEFRTRLVLAEGICKTVLGGIIAGMPGTSESLFHCDCVSAYIADGDISSINIYIPMERVKKGIAEYG